MASRCFLQGDVLTTKYQVDLGDGFKAMYVNLTLTGEPIRHRYESPGVYRVSVRAENAAGHDEAVLFVQVNCKSSTPEADSLPVTGTFWSLGKHRGPLGLVISVVMVTCNGAMGVAMVRMVRVVMRRR